MLKKLALWVAILLLGCSAAGEEDGADEQVASALAGAACGSQAECNDDNPCTQDRCKQGFCTNAAKVDGASCSDDDACTKGDSCLSGQCVSGAPTVCAPANQCQTSSGCSAITGKCVYASTPGASCDDGNACTSGDNCTRSMAGVCAGKVVPNGTTCDDGNASTVDDVCTLGACAGVDRCANVVCSALDQCHTAGTCDPATGACSNPALADGTTCDDGNASTVDDVCTLGTCAGVDLCAGVVCSALDQCHSAGTCDPATGECSDPDVADGTACDDGNASTVDDVCTLGTCAGVDLCAGVVCSALDQCHKAGVCKSATGTCSTPPVPDGTTCDDGSASTVKDVCTRGICAGVDLCAGVVCSADQCHTPGTCDPAKGVCSKPEVTEGIPCDDGNPSTLDDACKANGVCVGIDRCAGVVCSALDQCHAEGSCDPATGLCSDPAVADGTTCDDGSASTVDDVCTLGTCAGVDRCANVICKTAHQCQTAACDPATGRCADSPVEDGTTCDDDDASTIDDVCTLGVCAGVERCASVVCTALDQCHSAGTCDPATGVCSNPVVEDLTPCKDGNACTQTDRCEAGVCLGLKPVVCEGAGWTSVDSLLERRDQHQAIALDDGDVLVLGGGRLTSAERFDVDTWRWSPAGQLLIARYYPGVARLPDGRILVAGGSVNFDQMPMATTEIYDPSSNSWSKGATMNALHYPALATNLPKGKVVLASPAGSEVYDPQANVWTRVTTDGIAGFASSLVTLMDGSALLVGGRGAGGGSTVAKTHRFSEGSMTWISQGPLRTARSNFALVALADGRALAAGGLCNDRSGLKGCNGKDNDVLASVELFDPVTGTWSPAAPLPAQRNHATGVLLSNGKVLVTGDGSSTSERAQGLLYDPETNSWTPVPSQRGQLQLTTLTALPGGAALLAGGFDSSLGASTAVSEVYSSDDPCLTSSCEPSTGECVDAPVADGTACTDEDACTQTDICVAGSCSGTNPITCREADGCHTAGTCDPSSGVCTNPERWFVSVAAGAEHTCALMSDETVTCWGSNSFGQLADGTFNPSTQPRTVPSLGGVLAVATGDLHSCALLSDGTVSCWGNNDQGQLGNGSRTRSTTPFPVDGLLDVAAITSGAAHACALRSDGSAACWGANPFGNLGNGSTQDSTVPLDVRNLNDADTLTAGNYHTCATHSTGRVSCWGNNGSGQLGNGTMTQAVIPTPASGAIDGATSLAAGYSHTCAALPNLSLKCFGLNASGQLGVGASPSMSALPLTVSIPNAVTDVTGGQAHTCALLNDGRVACWGFNGLGQVGNGTTTNTPLPVPLAISHATAVNAGAFHTCAVLESGEMACWGFNARGQLGDGTTLDHTTPVAVPLCSGI